MSERDEKEEQNMFLLLQKAQAAKEKARMMADMRAKNLKEKLNNDKHHCKLNMHKLNEKWLSNIRQARAADLREDFEKLTQNLERGVALKDNAIKLLFQHLDKVEQKSQYACNTHLQNIVNLLEVQKKHLAEMQSNWDSSIKELSAEYKTKREQITKLKQQDTKYMESDREALEKCDERITFKAKVEYEYTCDSIRKEYFEKKRKRESAVVELRQQYISELEKYRTAIDDQEENALNIDRDILKMNKQLKKLQDAVNIVNTPVKFQKKEDGTCVYDLQEKCQELNKELQQLRANLNSINARQKTRLVNESVASNKTTETLKKVIEKEEKVLDMFAVCHKWESESPFNEPSVNAEEQSQEEARAEENLSTKMGQKMVDYADLNQFTKRYNKVVLEQICLEREKKILQEVLQDQKEMLRKIAGDIECSIMKKGEEVMAKQMQKQKSRDRDLLAKMHRSHFTTDNKLFKQHTQQKLMYQELVTNLKKWNIPIKNPSPEIFIESRPVVPAPRPVNKKLHNNLQDKS